MSHETTLIYTEPLLRQAVFAFWRRSVGGVAYAVALGGVAFGLGVLAGQGAASWLVGALGTALVLGVVLPTALYFVHYRNTLRKFLDMGSPRATFRADDSSFTMSSDIGTTTLKWSAVKEVWQFSGMWLLLYSKAQFSTLPLACMSPEMHAFVLQRVRASGGRVCA